jgi:acetylornithine deacetylase
MATTDRPDIADRVEQLLAHLVAMPTESTTPNRQLIDWVADHLHTFGATVSIIEGPLGRANLLASIGPAAPGGLLLSGHTDVVPAGSGWATDPYVLTIDAAPGTHLAGRGTADMKGFIACVLVAVEELDAATLARPVHVALSFDEEVGCVGVRHLLDQLLVDREHGDVRPDLVLIGEPTMMRPRHAHLGKVAYRLTFIAKSAHSSLSPFLPNAISSAARVIVALAGVAEPHRASAVRDESGEANAEVTVNIGSISGGGALNVLADRCELTFELRHSNAHSPDDLLDVFWACVDAERTSLSEHGGDVHTVEIARYPALETNLANPWVRVVERIADRGPSTALGYGTEGGLFAQTLGTAVMVCGPGDIAVAHKPDEYVSSEQLLACSAFVSRLIDEVSRTPRGD